MKRLLITNTIRINAIRNKNELYFPGGGIRSIKDIEEERQKLEKDGENPMDYTIFGNKRIKDVFHYTDRKAGKGYSDFSNEVYPNRRYIWQPLRKYFKLNWYLAAFMLVLVAVFPYDIGKGEFTIGSKFTPEAATLDENEEKKNSESDSTEDEENAESCEILSEEQRKKKKKKIGFRERRIIEYENRLRTYSSPDKIFRYFATLKINTEDGNYEVYMTPEDFVRSLTPGVIQPKNLGLDKFKIFDQKNYKRGEFSDRESIFNQLDNHGLISFSDYLFLMTLLSMPQSEFKLAFSIFDYKGDGELDKEEFTKMQKLLLSQTNVGQKHRDHVLGGSSFKWSDNSAILNYFFGEDGKRKLRLDTLLKFQHHLHRDILKIEFERRDPDSNPVGIISEISFAELLLMHAGLPEKRQQRMIKRIKKKYKGGMAAGNKGIDFNEVDDFFQFLYYIDDVDLALHFYKLAGKSLSKELLMKVARKIAHVELTDNLVDAVITLFDENGDGELSHKEFVSIMKKRMQRGLEKPKDTGLIRLMDAVWECGKNQVYNYIRDI